MNAIDPKDLRKLKSLADFSAAQLEKLARALALKDYAKSEIIFDQNEEAKLVHLVIAGVVRISYLNGHERQTIVSLVPAGHFFGLDALIPKSEYPFRCEAFEPATVAAIKPPMLVEALLGTPYETFLHWHTATMHPTRRSYIHCVRGIGLDLRRRLALELLSLAELFGASDARGIAIALNVSHEDLAGIVGASRQQVTQHLNELDREKIISRDGRRIIVNTQKLKKIIELG